MGFRQAAVLLAAVLFAAATPTFADVPAPERAALEALFISTNGAFWYDRSNWLGVAGSECSWFGVTCDAGGNTVTAIDLEGNNLDGPIPAIIDDLPNLEFLNLRGNILSGSLPDSLGNLSSLLELDLGYGGGSIIGPIPSTLGNLTSLQLLDLSAQALTGSIPTSILGLSNLSHLSLAYNNLSGGIPPAISGLGSLEVLDLASNPLGGSLPAELGALSSLTMLNLPSLGLVGSIPQVLGSLPNLEVLVLRSNELDGGIPPELGNLPSLSVLNLLGNQLTGEIPPELGGLATLGSLTLAANRLSGTIPPELGSLSGLWYLNLGSNSLTGEIPPELGSLAALSTLDLSSNQLSGEIPAALSGLSNIYRVNLGDNRLVGAIPAALGSLATLRYLDLSDNSLEGPLPSELGNLANLYRLQVNGNRIVGEVPASLTGMTSLLDDASDFRWNGLYTETPAVSFFLESKQVGGVWHDTQTVAPGLVFHGTYPGSIELELTPIAYTAGAGGYDVEMATFPGGPYGISGRLAGKSGGDIWLFLPDTLSIWYFPHARAWTAPHADNRNTVVSDWGDEHTIHHPEPQFALYVDPSGTPGNDCLSPATPCPDISSVFQTLHTGVRVFVAPGVYTENLSPTYPVELVGADPSTTIIDGGGGDRVIFHSTESLSLKNLTIRNGTATEGGGIHVFGGAALTMENCIVENNAADTGGGIHVAYGATADLRGTVIRSNTVDDDGGGIASSGGVWLDGCTIDGNQATGSSPSGSGIRITGLYSFLWMSDTAVTGNECNGYGGGLTNGGFAHVERSLISGNVAIGAAAINNATGSARMELENSTISGNTSLGYNSPIAIAAPAPLAMDSCTVFDNTGAGPDAPAISGGGTTVRGSIIADNSPVNCSEPLESLGWNLEDTDSCGLDEAGDQVGVDPLLDVLADYGGPTQTHALLDGSPAIDAGHPYLFPATDQRGFLRPVDGDSSGTGLADIGAVEAHGWIFSDGFESGDASAWTTRGTD
jgi:Leucine-rich repeat (LRR) protein